MNFISVYGDQILYLIITAALTSIGTWIGKKYQETCNERIKRDTVKTCVNAVEQLYPDLHGEEKYIKATESIKEILTNKNIVITDLEIKMLIEEQCNKFNQHKVKNKENNIEGENTEE